MTRPEQDIAVLPHRSAPVRRETPGFAVAVLRAFAYDVTYVSNWHVIGFTFERQEGVGAFASDQHRAFHADPWRLAFTPAGCEVFSASARGGEYLVLSIEPATFARLAPETRRTQLPQFTNVADPLFTPLGMALRRATMLGVVSAPLAVEELAAAAVEQAATRISGRALMAKPARGMTPRRLKRILEYLDAHLDEGVRLADLAGDTGLSDAYLARAFKAATGTTLHAALLERRIARARRLIESAHRGGCGTSTNLADIAAATGFSSHAHMTTAFRRVLGVTPSGWSRMV